MGISSDDLIQRVKEHMADQPFSCTCAECGAKLETKVEVDQDLDLLIEVFVCDCAKVSDDG